MAAAAALTVLPRAAGVLRLSQHGRSASRLLCAAAGDGEASPAPRAGRLVLYTKPGCCLCDGLKEKLQAAFLLAGTPYSLASLELQERDITTNPDWEQMYQYEIPVLAKVLPDGSEEKLPRLSPRLSVELVQKKVFSAFDQ
ncbi:uncharacterized protein [Oryza sativa Japonica Group]|jgi:hypothetical protein|uniref:Glutaredoxin-like protein n=3 Tax=Oryza sativa TaxID=4530 RepID=A0A0P0VQ04_ORYSJ|nr:uncharacterized protein LOC4330847 [Oryza sativa Japonica Group]EEC74068.1 hypothetical protein OsI_09078 [Oryza sativa Indica Group]KAB8089066.1 hypothetical protein EE612_013886 [Oryza sativa]KAF2947136.1 hypothetical protein DAI22_02g346600 [Oryza sativa Japonica Group]BAD16927.1 unknown protein [Oryza sativa Japonica Group]BAF10148.1 Os02g0767900 [Oryza sativa Japonica Group]|eukprot:NP_001048234.1 Os02g0767900 [Oryza sativa Japonica Group]